MIDVISPYIFALIVAWIVAHIIKYAIALSKGKQVDFTHQLFISGGMPSSHAATSVAVWMVVLCRDGVTSGLFGLATLVAAIICYDAVKVRRSVGEQGAAIQQIIKKQKLKIDLPRAARGHTPIEIFAGSILGAMIGLVVYIATN